MNQQDATLAVLCLLKTTSMLYIRHVELRVPRGPHGSHLCCHEGHTRQLTEVI